MLKCYKMGMSRKEKNAMSVFVFTQLDLVNNSKTDLKNQGWCSFWQWLLRHSSAIMKARSDLILHTDAKQTLPTCESRWWLDPRDHLVTSSLLEESGPEGPRASSCRAGLPTGCGLWPAVHKGRPVGSFTWQSPTCVFMCVSDSACPLKRQLKKVWKYLYRLFSQVLL